MFLQFWELFVNSFAWVIFGMKCELCLNAKAIFFIHAKVAVAARF
jgi:hypothetical protein